jgi:hypothetical protein
MAATQAQTPTERMSNAQIIELHQLGMTDAVILAKIKAAPGSYDTSISGLKALKAAGISQAVIAALLDLEAKKQGTASVSAAPAQTVVPPSASSVGGMAIGPFRSVEAMLFHSPSAGKETCIKLTPNELKLNRSKYEITVSPYGNSSEIQLSSSPTRIELNGYDPKTFLRYGKLVVIKFGKGINNGSRYVCVTRNLSGFDLPLIPLPISAKKISSAKFEQTASGLWQIAFTEKLEPGHYGLFAAETPIACWDFDVL